MSNQKQKTVPQYVQVWPNQKASAQVNYSRAKTRFWVSTIRASRQFYNMLLQAILKISLTPGTASGIQKSTGNRPIKALKGSLESKLTRQESRITAVENNMQEMPEMYGGKNLNDLFAPSAQRLAIKLAIAIKGVN